MTLSGLLVGVTLALFTMTGAKMTASAGDAGPMPPDRAKIEAETAAHRAAFRIKSIDHTGFTVSSLDNSLKFWVDVLGFKHLYTWTFDRGPFIEQLVGVPGAGMRLAMVEGPGHMIELLEYTSPDDRQIFKPRSSDVGSVHLAFYVENTYYAIGVASASNPFRFGALALDEAFTNREREIAELRADVTNGQDVVVFAPRRYGKSSLMWRVAQELVRRKVLVASVDLMTTPTVAKLAEKLARTIHEDVASKKEKALDRLRIFGSLRVKPTVNVDPDTGKLSFGFDAGYRPEDLRATLEHLLALPGELGAERGRRVALIFDEFQEVVDIDPGLPRLMRAVFQAQPEVAHVYLGSKRHMMRRLFSDENEPFWRSAKPVELGVIALEPFGRYIVERFGATAGRSSPTRSMRCCTRPMVTRTPRRSSATSSGS